ncbi:MAG: ABC transporter ATP-binding protein [Planctomycetes bacterium]|nr:ABC transporter ATP-binding protein [Planctomycetota bacterium]
MIQLKDISCRVGDFKLRNISMTIAGGSYFVLLGPAGSGKSILLECICGIRPIESGRILIDGKDITKLPPGTRNIGYVPQDYALFKHLSVADNIGFALKIQGQTRTQRTRQVSRVAEMLSIENILDRPIHRLSAGQQQRIALARALVAEPTVLLLDEPVSALDEANRQEICALLRIIAKDFKFTVLHVSHNLEESFTVAESAAVMRDGMIEQSGILKDLLRKPGTEFVARYMRCENIYSCEATGAIFPGGTEVKFGNKLLVLPGSLNTNVKFMIRPENIRVFMKYAGWREDENTIPVKVLGFRDFGSHIRIELDGPAHMVAHMQYSDFQDLGIPSETNMLAWLPREAIHVLEDEQP